MNTEGGLNSSAGRLNPFIFPSETTARFLVLIIAVAGASLFIYDLFFFVANGAQYSDLITVCLAEAEIGDPNFNRCMAPLQRAQAASSLRGLTILLVLGAVFYWLFPAWRIRRHHLTRLREDDAPELVADLQALSREAGLKKPPHFLVNPHAPAVTGLAFGRLGKYYVALSAGLVTKYVTDLPSFRAIVRHELAHLRNADVDKAYFAVAIGWAFLLVTLLPLLFSVFLPSISAADLINLVWRALVLIVLVFLIRNAVLRTRELYADARASTLEPESNALHRILQHLPDPGHKRPWSLRNYHPRPEQRLRVLHDTDRLFRSDFGLALVTGLMASIAMSSVHYILYLLASATGQTVSGFLTGEIASLGASLIVILPAVAVVGTGVWRAAFAARLAGQTPPGNLRLALGMALGYFVGSFLSLQEGYQSLRTAPVRFIFYTIVATHMLVGLLFIFTCIRATVTAWFAHPLSRRGAQRLYAAGLATAGLAMALWFWPLIQIQEVTDAFPAAEQGALAAILFGGTLTLGTLWLAFQYPFTIFALSAAWLLPLTAASRRRRHRPPGAFDWAYLQSPPQSIAPTGQADFYFGLTIVVALAGALAASALFLILDQILKDVVGDGVRFFYVLAAGVLFQPVVAAIIAASAKRLRVPHALLGALLTGGGSAAGIFAVRRLDACVGLLFAGTQSTCSPLIDLEIAWSLFSQITGTGALFAVPAALAASRLARALTPRHTTSSH